MKYKDLGVDLTDAELDHNIAVAGDKLDEIRRRYRDSTSSYNERSRRYKNRRRLYKEEGGKKRGLSYKEFKRILKEEEEAAQRLIEENRRQYREERDRQQGLLNALIAQRAYRRRMATRGRRWQQFEKLSTDELIALTNKKLTEQEAATVLALLLEQGKMIADVITGLRQRRQSKDERRQWEVTRASRRDIDPR